MGDASLSEETCRVPLVLEQGKEDVLSSDVAVSKSQNLPLRERDDPIGFFIERGVPQPARRLWQ